jgi:DNA polymerase III epsilon subunit-like protein
MFGGALNLPKYIHFICLDIATCLYAKKLNYSKELEVVASNLEFNGKLKRHNALFDAQVTKLIFEKFEL